MKNKTTNDEFISSIKDAITDIVTSVADEGIDLLLEAPG